MSSDLYTSSIPSDVFEKLKMRITEGGYLDLEIEVKQIDGDTDSCSFYIPPTPEGWKEAENLIGALQEWVKHTKELEEQRIWAEGLTKGLDR